MSQPHALRPGRFYGIGLGPGDPELLTLKALRLLGEADIVAYPTARAGQGQALAIVAPHLRPDQGLLPLVYPVTAGPEADAPDYRARLTRFYEETSAEIAGHLRQGRTVALVCTGDPFFYGSFVYWYGRLAPRFDTLVVPGVSSALAAPVVAGTPLCLQTDVTTIIPGTLPEDEIRARLKQSDAAVIMKLGRSFAKVRAALEATSRLGRAIYVERATMAEQRIRPAAEVAAEEVPYFSIIIVPGQREI